MFISIQIINCMKTKLLIIGISILTFILTEVSYTGQLLELKRSYNAALIEPLSYVSLAISVSMFVLLFVGHTIYSKWIKYFVYWYGSVAVILIFSGSVGSSYTWPSRSSMALFFGSCLVIGTIIFVLVQKFVYKK